MPERRLSETPSLVEALVKAQIPRPPKLKRDQISFEASEAKLESFNLVARPRKRWGLQFSFHVPFEGDLDFSTWPAGRLSNRWRVTSKGKPSS